MLARFDGRTCAHQKPLLKINLSPYVQTLMKIVPEDSKLVAEVKLANRNPGFVDIGQKTRIKVETFEFTKFGAIEGTVIDMSPDAVVDEKLGPVYLAKIELAQ